MALPEIFFATDDVGAVPEGNYGNPGGGVLTFIIRRTGDLAQPSVVSFSVGQDPGSTTDKSDLDGVVINGSFSGDSFRTYSARFAAGASSITVEVYATDNRSPEPDEAIRLRLTGVTGGVLVPGSTLVSRGTFLNDDVNTPPIARADGFRTGPDGAVPSAFVLSNDTDPDGGSLRVVGFTQPSHGTVFVTTAGVMSYAAQVGFGGTDSFTYTVSDGFDSATATVSVTVPQFTEGTRRDDTLSGSDLPDNIKAGAGNDLLLGGAGADSLHGGPGNDTLDGGPGSDTLIGTHGADVFIIDDPGDRIIWRGGRSKARGADDTLVTPFGSNGDQLRDELKNVVLTGTNAGNLPGNMAPNRLTGNVADNRLAGREGNDTLTGSDGADTLLGQRGDDRLQGGKGADVLEGGGGNDVLHYASSDEGGDTILRYRASDDRVEVSAAGFGAGLVAGMDLVAAGRYVSGRGPTTDGEVGQFLFDTATESLWWDPDGSGEEDAVRLFTLAVNGNFVASGLTVIA